MKALFLSLIFVFCVQVVDAQVIRVPVGMDSLIWVMPDTSSELWCKGGPTVCYFQSSIAMDTVAPFYIQHVYTKSSFGDTNIKFLFRPRGIRILPYREFLFIDTVRVLYSLIDSGKKYCGTFNCPIGMYVYKPLQVQGFFDDKVRMSVYSYSDYFKLRTHYDTIYLAYDTTAKAYKIGYPNSIHPNFIVYNNKEYEIDMRSFALSGDSSSFFTFELIKDSLPRSTVSVPAFSYDSSLALKFHCALPAQDSDVVVNINLDCTMQFNGIDSLVRMPLAMHLRAAPKKAIVKASHNLNSIHVFPNPGTGSLLMNLLIQGKANTSISIFDELGREVRRMHDGFLDAGEHEFSAELPAGMYYVRMQAGDEVLTRKVTVVR